MSFATRQAINWTEQGLVPDSVTRGGIRRLLRARLAHLRADDVEFAGEATARFISHMNSAPIAPLPHKANEQHYELPPEFFAHTLGPNRKYSCCDWAGDAMDLAGAESEALANTAKRAQLADGQQILELGCGWGSLTLHMAQRFPRAAIVAVSNSGPQREYITREAKRRGLENIEVITCDMNTFATARRFDRVVSVEMFEHMRNYSRLFESIRDWLVPDGKFFMHIFVHRSVPYAFEEQDADDWMSKYFFSSGMMPCAALPLHFQDHLRLERQWNLSGRHYEKTADAWLANLDRNRAQVLPILEATYGQENAGLWLQRWRIFFMACPELWGFRDGQEWFVSHYLFQPRPA